MTLQSLAVAVTFFVFGMAIDWLVRELRRWWDLRREARGERAAHEALKAQSAELLAKRDAMPASAAPPAPRNSPKGWEIRELTPAEQKIVADWPAHVEHPLADPTATTSALPAVNPGKHAL